MEEPGKGNREGGRGQPGGDCGERSGLQGAEPAEGEERHVGDPFVGQSVDQFVVVAVGEVVHVLHADDRGDGLGLENLLVGGVADAEVPDEALLLHLGEGLECFGDRPRLSSFGVSEAEVYELQVLESEGFQVLVDAGCPSRALLDRISNKWVTLVLCTLGGGMANHAAAGERGSPRAMRFSELSRTLVGVSQKMLTQTLRALERDGLITRTVTPTVPVTVSYELTELGVSLHHLMGALKSWAEANMDDVLANRAVHDSRPA